MPKPKKIPVDILEHKMRIFADIKTVCVRDKNDGMWYWYGNNTPKDRYGPFTTWLRAMADAVQPYWDELYPPKGQKFWC